MYTSIQMDWVKEVKAKEIADNATAQAKALLQANAELNLKAKAHIFFQDMAGQITLAVAALNPNLREGSVSRWGNPDYEQGLRVSMNRVGIVAKETYTDLFFMKGQTVIRCTTVEGKSFPLSLRVNVAGEVSVSAGAGSANMDHRQAARFILEPMMRITS